VVSGADNAAEIDTSVRLSLFFRKDKDSPRPNHVFANHAGLFLLGSSRQHDTLAVRRHRPMQYDFLLRQLQAVHTRRNLSLLRAIVRPDGLLFSSSASTKTATMRGCKRYPIVALRWRETIVFFVQPASIRSNRAGSISWEATLPVEFQPRRDQPARGACRFVDLDNVREDRPTFPPLVRR